MKKMLYKIASFFLMQSLIISSSALAGDVLCLENKKLSKEYLSPQITYLVVQQLRFVTLFQLTDLKNRNQQKSIQLKQR